MMQILKMPSGSVRYLSKTTQNEFIVFYKICCGETCIRNKFSFSLMLDITQDISKKDQLSVIVRTDQIIRDANGLAIRFEIRESF